ncbi:unnamed protein product [Ambrosiozyma monospora]|uniref:Unnamed protein product n=1 Tax=Ambrosiozyma monospora TaxID=43982 RepID=A0ACB5T695_AMBMO|nr:unnamed protein product [Ambrosiozyma monospora]
MQSSQSIQSAQSAHSAHSAQSKASQSQQSNNNRLRYQQQQQQQQQQVYLQGQGQGQAPGQPGQSPQYQTPQNLGDQMQQTPSGSGSDFSNIYSDQSLQQMLQEIDGNGTTTTTNTPAAGNVQTPNNNGSYQQQNQNQNQNQLATPQPQVLQTPQSEIYSPVAPVIHVEYDSLRPTGGLSQGVNNQQSQQQQSPSINANGQQHQLHQLQQQQNNTDYRIHDYMYNSGPTSAATPTAQQQQTQDFITGNYLSPTFGDPNLPDVSASSSPYLSAVELLGDDDVNSVYSGYANSPVPIGNPAAAELHASSSFTQLSLGNPAVHHQHHQQHQIGGLGMNGSQSSFDFSMQQLTEQNLQQQQNLRPINAAVANSNGTGTGPGTMPSTPAININIIENPEGVAAVTPSLFSASSSPSNGGQGRSRTGSWSQNELRIKVEDTTYPFGRWLRKFNQW